MKKIFDQWQKLLFKSKKSHNLKLKNQGFTLVELLVTILIAGVIIAPILSLMFGLMQDNRKDMASSETQQEMSRALKYMSNELKGAVYVYNGTQLKYLVDKQYLPDFGTNNTPILAFWEVEPVPYNTTDKLPTDCTVAGVYSKDECEKLKVSQRSYSLVVYTQSTANTSKTWKGTSRILRYQLRKFDKVTTTQLTLNTGYVDPLSESPSFADWPENINDKSLQTARPSNTNVFFALVDFVDTPTNDPKTGTIPTCQTGYERTPSDATNNKSFFACVRTASSSNQDTIIYLRGNSEGKYGLTKDKTVELPTLQTQVLNRGVIQKIVN